MDRVETMEGRLARLGFVDAEKAARLIADRPDDEDRLDLLAAADDPDLALAGLHRLVTDHPELPARLSADPVLADRLVAVLGASTGLQQDLFRFPEHIDQLVGPLPAGPAEDVRAELLHAVGADPAAAMPVATLVSGDELRGAYHGVLLRIAARDLTAADPVEVQPQVSESLADLADAVLEGALAVARGRVGGERAARVRLAVVALGKTGGRELNYVSDVDVLYVAEPADDAGTPACDHDTCLSVGAELAATLARICSAHTGAGTIWPVDAALRPEGKGGPLVRTLDSHRHYYRTYAKAWEFQAMLKARPAAGDLALGRAFVEMVAPMVWQVGGREGFVRETQAMRRRVVSLIPARERGRQIKLGEGGLRDVEFSVQILQLVHGRADERLRRAGTLAGLRALVRYGYVGREDGADLAAAYRLQRTIEHRVQLYRLRRTHLMPDDPADLRRIGRSLGWRLNPAEELVRAWRDSTRRVVALHQRIFYSPLLAAVSHIGAEDLRLTTDAAEARLRGLGYADPRAALNHIRALTTGVTRRTEIQRQILPAMLGWFAEGPNPDAGLLAFRQVSEKLGRTAWYLRTLRDGGAMAQRLAHILATSRYATDLLMRFPQSVEMLADEADFTPRPRAVLSGSFTSIALRHDDPVASADSVRGQRRRELLRIAMADLLRHRDVEEVGDALSNVTSATMEAALAVARRDAERAGATLPPLAVIALGRWGGGEMAYASDADCMIVMDDGADEAAQRFAVRVVTRIREVLRRPGPEPPLELDLDLRPEGRGGPLVRSLESFRTYYRRWSSTWEAQALVRASFGAGDQDLGDRLMAVIDPIRWPADGLGADQIREIRRLKARMEAERLPRGADRERHTKLGPGGLSDVEWTVQFVQLQHAGEYPQLRTPRTLTALRTERDLGLIDAHDAAVLEEAWLLASRIRNAITLVRGRPSDTLPTDGADAGAVADTLGYDGSGPLKAHYLAVTRRARAVVERLFWGD